MIKIGTKKDLSKISHLPMNIQNAICEDVGVLDNSYGENRNIDVDMGGFVVVCDANEVLDIENFVEDLEQAEYIQDICPYRKALYIAGTERNIIIYRKRS